jgi:hypothetical protein
VKGSAEISICRALLVIAIPNIRRTPMHHSPIPETSPPSLQKADPIVTT